MARSPGAAFGEPGWSVLDEPEEGQVVFACQGCFEEELKFEEEGTGRIRGGGVGFGTDSKTQVGSTLGQKAEPLRELRGHTLDRAPRVSQDGAGLSVVHQNHRKRHVLEGHLANVTESKKFLHRLEVAPS